MKSRYRSFTFALSTLTLGLSLAAGCDAPPEEIVTQEQQSGLTVRKPDDHNVSWRDARNQILRERVQFLRTADDTEINSLFTGGGGGGLNFFELQVPLGLNQPFCFRLDPPPPDVMLDSGVSYYQCGFDPVSLPYAGRSEPLFSDRRQLVDAVNGFTGTRLDGSSYWYDWDGATMLDRLVVSSGK
jgi:hypothetical protein